jgi:hypothetical protein
MPGPPFGLDIWLLVPLSLAFRRYCYEWVDCHTSPARSPTVTFTFVQEHEHKCHTRDSDRALLVFVMHSKKRVTDPIRWTHEYLAITSFSYSHTASVSRTQGPRALITFFHTFFVIFALIRNSAHAQSRLTANGKRSEQGIIKKCHTRTFALFGQSILPAVHVNVALVLFSPPILARFVFHFQWRSCGVMRYGRASVLLGSTLTPPPILPRKGISVPVSGSNSILRGLDRR